MSHSITNLGAYHIEYTGFRRPGNVHVHYFGTATESFSDEIAAQAGDVFEIKAEGFSRSLRKKLALPEDDT